MKLSTLSLALIFTCTVIGAGSALADPFTICVKDKNGKMNRGALGNSPAKGQCQNENKWSQVTLATEQNVIDLAFDLELTQEELALLNGQINDEDGIADMVQMNKDAIANLEEAVFVLGEDLLLLDGQINDEDGIADMVDMNKEAIGDLQSQVDAIATVIGGSTGPNELNDDGTQFMGMFVGRARMSDRNVENRIPVAGTLSDFWARQGGADPPLTGDAQRVLTVLLRQNPNDAVPTDLGCTLQLPDNEFVCADNIDCVDVVANRRISVEIQNLQNTGTLSTDVSANWSAKFTPGAVCPVEP